MSFRDDILNERRQTEFAKKEKVQNELDEFRQERQSLIDSAVQTVLDWIKGDFQKSDVYPVYYEYHPWRNKIIRQPVIISSVDMVLVKNETIKAFIHDLGENEHPYYELDYRDEQDINDILNKINMVLVQSKIVCCNVLRKNYDGKQVGPLIEFVESSGLEITKAKDGTWSSIHSDFMILI